MTKTEPPELDELIAALECHPTLLFRLATSLHEDPPRVLSEWCTRGPLSNPTKWHRHDCQDAIRVEVQLRQGGPKWEVDFKADHQPWVVGPFDTSELASAFADQCLREKGWMLL